MKLVFLIILLCGITSTPSRTVNITKKTCVCHAKVTTAKATTALDIVPSGLLFQF